MSTVAADVLAGLDPEKRARLLQALRSRAVRQAPAAIPPRDAAAPVPLSYEQRRLWIVDRLDPGNPAYNVAVTLRRPHALDAGLLARALEDVVTRHEVLRTTFVVGDDGEPVQVIHPPASFPLEVADLAHLPAAERQAEAERIARDQAQKRFDLAAGPLLRVTLLRSGDAESVVVLVIHHVVTDGSSTARLVHEITTRYAALAAGDAAPLAALPVQYGDYAAWQRGRVGEPEFQAHLDFWKRHLAGAPLTLELPADHPRPALLGARGAAVPLELAPDTASRCRLLAQEEGTTLFVVLLSAFVQVLARCTGREDPVVGVGVANRGRMELEELVGLFANALPLRADVAGDPSFRALVGRVHALSMEAQEHQSVPFELLVEALSPPRHPGRNPVFQVVFNLLSGSAPRPGDSLNPLSFDPWATQFDLTLAFREMGDELHGALQFNLDLFRPQTVRRIARHYTALLETALGEPDRPLSGLEVDVLDPAERERILRDWNATARPRSAEQTLHALFATRVRETPDAPAIVGDGEPVTYAELERRATRLARALRRERVGAEGRVGVCMERSPALVVAFLAALRAGAAYVPLDPAYPRERIAYMLADAGVALVLTGETVPDVLPGAVRTLALDAAGEVVGGADEDGDFAAPELGAASLAYLIYTSGSTGTPKGVMVPHDGLCNVAAEQQRLFGIGAGDRVLQFASPSFDASVFEMVLALASGAALCIAPPGAVPGPALVRRMAENGVTAAVLTPSTVAALPADGLPSLRVLMTAGEACSAELVARWAPGRRFFNLYGPTETTIWSTAAACEAKAAGAPPIGGPIGNVRAYVLDERGLLVPPGIPGELCVGGTGTARGYLGRPALTATRFVPDAFSAEPGARLYRTGDRVRWLDDGALEYLGRVDHQAKVRGFRIEPGEVEAVLCTHPAVAQAVVAPRPDPAGGTRLVGWVAGAPGSRPDAGELRAHLAARLPAHMVPSLLVVVDALPLTPNGKVDRAALPDPSPVARGEGDGFVAPATESERALAAIWETLLEVRPVGVDDDFFALGGHSMLAVRMVAEVERRFGVELPLSALFEHPTVARLARLLEDNAGTSGGFSPLVALQPQGGRIPLFFVHPMGGEVLCYADLARHLGADQPFFGLQAGDLARAAEHPASIEAMAARYVAAIRQARPHGPYLLGGWSFGGFVAFEMARQLADAGEEVPLVALLDPLAPDAARKAAEVEEPVVLAHLAREEGLKAGRTVRLTADDLRPLDTDARAERFLAALREAGVVSEDVDAGQILRLLAGYHARRRAVAEYHPGTYAGRLLLFVPSEYDADAESLEVWNGAASLGWREYSTQPVQVHAVPGHHATMAVGPQSAHVAAVLREEIGRVVEDEAAVAVGGEAGVEVAAANG